MAKIMAKIGAHEILKVKASSKGTAFSLAVTPCRESLFPKLACTTKSSSPHCLRLLDR